MKAGEYYIGDLCYVMNDEEWSEMCDLFFEGQDNHGCNEGVFTLKDGRVFACYNTNHGDGSYNTNIGGNCCVDSGSIGCILKSDIKTNKYDHIHDLGIFHTFDTDFETEFYMMEEYDPEEDYKYTDKVLCFGNVEVYT